MGLSEEITQHSITLDGLLNHDHIPRIKESDLGQDRQSDLSRIFSHTLLHSAMFMPRSRFSLSTLRGCICRYTLGS
jgi:hypothetical protein